MSWLWTADRNSSGVPSWDFSDAMSRVLILTITSAKAIPAALPKKHHQTHAEESNTDTNQTSNCALYVVLNLDVFSSVRVASGAVLGKCEFHYTNLKARAALRIPHNMVTVHSWCSKARDQSACSEFHRLLEPRAGLQGKRLDARVCCYARSPVPAADVTPLEALRFPGTHI